MNESNLIDIQKTNIEFKLIEKTAMSLTDDGQVDRWVFRYGMESAKSDAVLQMPTFTHKGSNVYIYVDKPLIPLSIHRPVSELKDPRYFERPAPSSVINRKIHSLLNQMNYDRPFIGDNEMPDPDTNTYTVRITGGQAVYFWLKVLHHVYLVQDDLMVSNYVASFIDVLYQDKYWSSQAFGQIQYIKSNRSELTLATRDLQGAIGLFGLIHGLEHLICKHGSTAFNQLIENGCFSSPKSENLGDILEVVICLLARLDHFRRGGDMIQEVDRRVLLLGAPFIAPSLANLYNFYPVEKA